MEGDMKPVLSTKELAEAIGVSESSIKRWVDDGTIIASRTSGGHRRIGFSQAVRFIRSRRSPIARPEVLGLVDVARLKEVPLEGGESDLLCHFLSEGMAGEARGLILSLYLGGESVASICDGPIRSSMSQIGTLWKESVDGILREHRATDICLQALRQLRTFLETAVEQEQRPIAVGGAPSGDGYLIPSLAVATTLLEANYQAVNLGPDTPGDTFEQAIIQHQPKLVWLSISHVPEPEKLVREWTPIIHRLAQNHIPLIVGGRRKDKLLLPDSPYLFAAGSLLELVALSRGFEVLSSETPSD
jgi:excisionase family DNA binding protein